MKIDSRSIWAIASRTSRNQLESPIFYVVGLFFFSFVGVLFSLSYFTQNQAGVDAIPGYAPWGLWFVIPVLTMGLFSEEMRTGTYESLATLPLSDTDIVLGKFLGFGLVALILNAALAFFVLVAAATAQPGVGIDWGASFGTIAGLYLLSLTFGAVGIFASSLSKSQVVAVIIAIIFCTFFFLIGQMYGILPASLARLADYLGVTSHVGMLSRGVWDLRDLLYFGSMIGFFLFLTVQRLSTRRF